MKLFLVYFPDISSGKHRTKINIFFMYPYIQHDYYKKSLTFVLFLINHYHEDIQL